MTDSKPSKSARKREQQELQALGEQLLALNDADLATVPLDDKLLDAINTAKKIKSYGALRRQRQYIGKLMRDIDPAPIRAALDSLRIDDVRQKRLFARAEKWRDRIVRERGAGLEAFEAEIGAADSELQRLMAELESALSDRAEKTARRQIFRRVHAILVRIAS